MHLVHAAVGLDVVCECTCGRPILGVKIGAVNRGILGRGCTEYIWLVRGPTFLSSDSDSIRGGGGASASGLGWAASGQASHPEGVVSTSVQHSEYTTQRGAPDTRDLSSRSHRPRLPKMAAVTRVKKFRASMSPLLARGCCARWSGGG